ncbi:LysR substrate-binding domain-containing protein [Shewanella sp. NIFS-20-20]|uniref:LysR substrate-binding domain-containing protein n=1 Tax=Shewanella sp. NIFS-20-20 TaxID=2853806 RepID=UPI001C483797|nr:LysR substrate-binding domain-containing protein [Shewanella sp. NIFS-20-20]MBV7315984.1 LysR family transcriptional regulator [Shewanella sp. NIFS-20-20]
MIELRHLRTLVALQQSGSLAAAAKIRFVTQSALSHQIKELETRINSQVFIRKSKPLCFTEEGSRLLRLAEDILPKVQHTEQLLKHGLDQLPPTIRAAAHWPVLNGWLSQVVEHEDSILSDAQLQLTCQHPQAALKSLVAGHQDLVLTSKLSSDAALAYQHVFDYEIRLLVAANHPLAEHQHIHAQDLQGSTLFSFPVMPAKSELVQHFLEPAGVEIKQEIACDSLQQVAKLLLQEQGVAALPHWAVNELKAYPLVSLTLGVKGFYRPLFAAYRRSDALNQPLQACIQALSQQGQGH